MFTLYSTAARGAYRKLSRGSVGFKFLSSKQSNVPRGLREDFVLLLCNKKFAKYIHTSASNNEKILPREGLNDAPGSKESKEKEKIAQSVIKQNAVGDIVVKTETDVNKVVTKVTIEKKPVDGQPQPSSAGKALGYFNICSFLYYEILYQICNICKLSTIPAEQKHPEWESIYTIIPKAFNYRDEGRTYEIQIGNLQYYCHIHNLNKTYN